MFLKRLMLFLMIPVLFISCSTLASFEQTSEGRFLSTEEVDTKLLKKSIKLALVKFNWIIVEESDDAIIARFSKSDNLIFAEIVVEYGIDGYSISYLNSKNLDVNLTKGRIHRNYNRWIANLNKTIYENYLLLEE